MEDFQVFDDALAPTSVVLAAAFRAPAAQKNRLLQVETEIAVKTDRNARSLHPEIPMLFFATRPFGVVASFECPQSVSARLSKPLFRFAIMHFSQF